MSERELNELNQLHLKVLSFRNNRNERLKMLESLIETTSDTKVKQGAYQSLHTIQQRIEKEQSTLLDYSFCLETMNEFQEYYQQLEVLTQWIEKDKILQQVSDGIVDCNFYKETIQQEFSQLFTPETFQQLLMEDGECTLNITDTY